MSIRSPKSPSTFRALDSAIFAPSGAPVSAFELDTIAQAHQRLQGGEQQMFCAPVPIDDVAYGEGTEARYTVALRRTWGRVVPDLPCRKKPGPLLADFRISARFDLDILLDFQVTTLAAPQHDRAGHWTVVGTGDWQTYSVNRVPVSAGGAESCGLWVRSSGELVTAPITWGGPSTGDIVAADPTADTLLCQAASGDITWVANAPSIASVACAVRVRNSDNIDVGVWDIRAVRTTLDITGTIRQGILTLPRGALSALGQAINSSTASTPWTYEILSLPLIELGGFAGVTRERTT